MKKKNCCLYRYLKCHRAIEFCTVTFVIITATGIQCMTTASPTVNGNGSWIMNVMINKDAIYDSETN